MEKLLTYAYEQKIDFLKQISMEYNLDYNKLILRYLDYFKTVNIVSEEIENDEVVYIDENDNKYNKNGFILK